MTAPRWIDAAGCRALGIDAACDVLEAAFLRDDSAPLRQITSVGEHQLLTMPAATADGLGAKVLSIGPEGRGGPRVQGLFVLFDRSGAPAAVIDGAALTLVRTPAVSLTVIRALLRGRRHPIRAVIVGGGPEAVAHAEALQSVLGDRPGVSGISMLVRTPRAPVADGTDTLVLGSRAAADALADADVVICATTARQLFFAPRRCGATRSS